MLLYGTSGGQWAETARITFSFAPDGTSVGGASSTLNAALAARGISSQTWRDQFRRAAAAWEQIAGINLVEVPDNGAPYGVSGSQQGDPRFGDIRIAGITLSAGTLGLAFATPPFNGGTLAGDIVVNSASAWAVNGNFDLQTVALHEIGHALGLSHSQVNQAVMYSTYNGIKQSLAADDVAGIQSIYDARPPDFFDDAASNQTITTASNLTSFLNVNGQAAVAGLDISTNTDYDWYRVVAPVGTKGTLSVTMQSTGLSLLSPRVQIYNAALQGLSQATDANAYGSTITASAAGVVAGQTYYIRAMAANNGPTGAGAYGLLVNFGSGSIGRIEPPDTAIASQSDQGGGSTADRVGRVWTWNRGAGSNWDWGDGRSWKAILASALGSLFGRFSDPDHDHERMTLGDLSGWGDELLVGAPAAAPLSIEPPQFTAPSALPFDGVAIVEHSLPTAPTLGSAPSRPKAEPGPVHRALGAARTAWGA